MKTLAMMNYEEWTVICQGLAIWVGNLEREGPHPRTEEVQKVLDKCHQARKYLS